MGSFRLLLAATVMLGHFVPFYPRHLPFLMYGSASVPAFYIVSGFLITLVLREKYQNRTGLFYSNRALRIFPLYWAALAVFLLVNWLVAKAICRVSRSSAGQMHCAGGNCMMPKTA